VGQFESLVRGMGFQPMLVIRQTSGSGIEE
jgi:hypothetical protein